MRLVQVRGQGFRSFDAPFQQTLPETGIVRLAGVSGVGKSTFLSAPAFALGYGPAATKAASWHGTPLEVEVTLRDGARTLTVERGARLKLTVDREKVKGNATTVEEALAKELGFPLEVIATLGHRRQKRGSAFLSLSDERKKAFLAGPAGIEDLEGRLKVGKARLATAQAAVDAAAANLAAVQGAAGLLEEVTEASVAEAEAALMRLAVDHEEAQRQEEQAKYALEEALAADLARSLKVQTRLVQEMDAAQGRLVKADRDLQALAGTLDQLPEVQCAASIEATHKKCLAMLDEERAAETVRRQTWEGAVRIAEGIVTSGRISLGRLPQLGEELVKQEAKIKALSLEVPACPTCAKPWPERGQDVLAGAVAERDRLKETLRRCGEDVRQAEEDAVWLKAHPWVAGVRAQDLAKADASLRANLAAAMAQAAAAKVRAMASAEEEARAAALASREARARYDQASNAPDPKTTAAQAAWDAARHAVEWAAAGAHQGGREVEGRRQALGRWRQAQERLQEARGGLGGATLARDEEADVLEAVRAFVGRFFDELLVEVADETNAILADVPNVQNCVISFRSEVTNKDGEVSRRAIVPVLAVGGHEIGLGDDDGASGGMVSSIHLAVDLGALQVLERRLGKKLGWLVMDEPFEGLDPACRQACMEILRQQSRDRLVLLVDHFSESEGLTDRTIQVTGEGGRSWLQK